MAENNQESRVSLDTLAHTQDDVSNGINYVNFLVSKLQQTMENPTLHGVIMLQLRELVFNIGRIIIQRAIKSIMLS